MLPLYVYRTVFIMAPKILLFQAISKISYSDTNRKCYQFTEGCFFSFWLQILDDKGTPLNWLDISKKTSFIMTKMMCYGQTAICRPLYTECMKKNTIFQHLNITKNQCKNTILVSYNAFSIWH